MEDNLHEKPRKELKQLCNQFNIRTAGVKVHNLQSDSFPFHSSVLVSSLEWCLSEELRGLDRGGVLFSLSSWCWMDCGGS